MPDSLRAVNRDLHAARKILETGADVNTEYWKNRVDVLQRKLQRKVAKAIPSIAAAKEVIARRERLLTDIMTREHLGGVLLSEAP